MRLLNIWTASDEGTANAFAEERFGVSHPPEIPIRGREEVDVVLVVPVVLGCDLLGLEVGHLDASAPTRTRRPPRRRGRAAAGRDRACAARAARAGASFAYAAARGSASPGAPAVLVRVRQVVLRGEMIRRHAERLLVERHRRLDAPLSAVGGIGRLGDASQQPQLHVDWDTSGAPHRARSGTRPARRSGARRLGGHLQRAGLDVRTVVLRCPRRQRTSALDRRLRLRRRVQLDKATLRPAWAMASAGSIRSAWLNERAASIQT